MKHIFQAALLLLILFFASAAPCWSQTDLMRQVEQRFSRQANRAVLEKLYVHTDRSFYLAGESMWFKIYAVDGSLHTPLDLSKVAYLEVLDAENKPVLQTKIALEASTGKGSFYLPLSLSSGTYKVRAYTSWMKNFGPDYFFEKEISLVNSFVVPQLSEPEQKTTGLDVQFFPEGGDLVAGISCKVAFKAVDSVGKGRSFRGAVHNAQGDTVALLSPLHLGMGHFNLQPQAGVKYTASVQADSGGQILTVVLPPVRDRGYGMRVEERTSGELTVSVHSTFNDQQLHLFVHTRQQVKAVLSEAVQGGQAVFKISQQQLGEGISHLTLFNQNRQPVAERLWFTHPRELQIEVATNKPVYASREKVSLSLSAGAAANTPLEANLSMAVYRLDSLQQPDAENILSELWLTSDLKGKIESPLYYFENSHKVAKEALDNLLLTQGWRRFRWEDVLQQETPAFAHMPEYEGHILKVVVQDSATGAPLPGIIASLSVPGRLLQFHTSKSNQQGELFFVTDRFFGEMDILIQNAAIKRNGLAFRIASPYADAFIKAGTAPLRLTEAYSEELRQHHVHMQVQNVYWQEELNRLIVPELDSIAFFGAPDKTYLLDNYTRFPSMEEVMREYVYEVRVRKNGGNFTFRVAKPTRDGFYNGLPLMLLDGKPVVDASDLIAYNPLKIQKLDILQERFILGGNMIFDGVISYTSYKGITDDLPLADDILQHTYDGLQLQREFYSPVYEAATAASIRTPDFRQLLYWAPDIQLSGNEEQQLEFYTSDLKGRYMVVIQGLSQEGQAGSQTLFFDVRDNAF